MIFIHLKVRWSVFTLVKSLPFQFNLGRSPSTETQASASSGHQDAKRPTLVQGLFCTTYNIKVQPVWSMCVWFKHDYALQMICIWKHHFFFERLLSFCVTLPPAGNSWDFQSSLHWFKSWSQTLKVVTADWELDLCYEMFWEDQIRVSEMQVCPF